MEGILNEKNVDSLAIINDLREKTGHFLPRLKKQATFSLPFTGILGSIKRSLSTKIDERQLANHAQRANEYHIKRDL